MGLSRSGLKIAALAILRVGGARNPHVFLYTLRFLRAGDAQTDCARLILRPLLSGCIAFSCRTAGPVYCSQRPPDAPISGAEVRSTEASAPSTGQAASGASGDWFQFDDWNDASYARLVFGKDGIGLSELAEEVVSLFAFKHFRMRPIGSPLFFNRD